MLRSLPIKIKRYAVNLVLLIYIPATLKNKNHFSETGTVPTLTSNETKQ